MPRTSDRLYVVRSGAVTTSVAVALAAATPKTVVACMGSAADTIALVKAQVSFDGIAANATPALVEIGIITALGTGTAFTPQQWKGATVASSVTAAYNHTGEPTYNRILDNFYAPVLMGYLEKWAPLGDEIQADPSQGFAIRITSPSAVNCHANLVFAE